MVGGQGSSTKILALECLVGESEVLRIGEGVCGLTVNESMNVSH